MAATTFEIKMTLDAENGWVVSMIGVDGPLRKQLAAASMPPDNVLRIANGIDKLCPQLINNETHATALTLVTIANDQVIRFLKAEQAQAARDLANKTRTLDAFQETMRRRAPVAAV